MMPDLETPSEQDGAVLDARARYMKRYYIVATASIMAVFLIAVCALWQVLSWSDAALIGVLIMLPDERRIAEDERAFLCR